MDRKIGGFHLNIMRVDDDASYKWKIKVVIFSLLLIPFAALCISFIGTYHMIRCVQPSYFP